MPTYKKNFINEAIIRIDFHSPIDSLNNHIPKTIDNMLIKSYTFREPINRFNNEIKIDAATGNVETSRVPKKEWNYYGNEKKKRIVVMKDCAFVIFNEYISYPDFSEHYIKLLNLLKEEFPEARMSRLGMRYINHLSFDDGGEVLDWTKYLSENLLASLSVKFDGSSLLRAIQVLEHGYENGILVKYQYGMHNPDYPSTVKKKHFLLDIDAYKKGELSFEHILEILPEVHALIGRYFEGAITSEMRDYLNE